MPGSLVLLQSEGGVRYLEHAGPDGFYRFQNLPGGTYKMEISMWGFRSKLAGPVAISGDELRELPIAILQIGVACGSRAFPYDLRLLPGDTYGLAGTIEDKRGVPLAKVTVSLVCPNGGVCGDTKTNSRGEYSFAALERGTFTLKVSKKGFYPIQESGFPVREGFESIIQPIFLERCFNGNCDAARRPKPPAEAIEICY